MSWHWNALYIMLIICKRILAIEQWMIRDLQLLCFISNCENPACISVTLCRCVNKSRVMVVKRETKITKWLQSGSHASIMFRSYYTNLFFAARRLKCGNINQIESSRIYSNQIEYKWHKVEVVSLNFSVYTIHAARVYQMKPFPSSLTNCC